MTKKTKAKSDNKQHIPQTVADSIPYLHVFKNGLIEIKPGYFSRSYRIPPMNFKTANQKSQWKIAESYAQFLGTFEPDVDVQVTLHNKTVNIEEFQKDVFLEMKSDSLNMYRGEVNDMLLEKMTGAKNNIQTDKYLTISLPADDVFHATERFASIDGVVTEHMTTITKFDAPPMTIEDRLEVLNLIYNQDSTVPLCEERTIQGHKVQSFSLENCARQGITTKDVIAPSSMTFSGNIAKIGTSFARSYYISNYPTWIKGTLLTAFAQVPANMLVSVYFNTIAQEDAVKMIKRQGVNIAASLVESQKRASKSGYDPSLISPDLQDAKAETNELLEGVTKDNGRLFNVNFIITLFAPSEEALAKLESQVKMIASTHLVTVKSLDLQQEQAFDSALPLAHNKLSVQRLMTTNTVASIIPFDVKEVRQKNGMYYGLNAASRNMILYNRKSFVNPNACILGMPGAGKSFSAKREMINVLLGSDDEVYVIDPENEYAPMARALGGSVITIANGSNIHINPFDMNIENAGDDGDPVKVKSDFIETICEIAIGGKYGLSPGERTIIGRCVANIYEPYIQEMRRTGKTMDQTKCPTMLEFYNDLLAQPQTEAQNLALALERYVKGALDMFSKPTNVDINNRFTIYNIKDIGAGMKELGLQICLDNIWNKMIANKAKGKFTWIYIDEFYLLMKKPTSAAYIEQIWKRARKWNGLPTAITQNVEDMLKSEEARTVINNCSSIIFLGQSPINKQQLSDMFDISPVEQKYISAAKPGMGLIRVEENILPMDDSFPKDTQLYKLMTTRPQEVDERL